MDACAAAVNRMMGYDEFLMRLAFMASALSVAGDAGVNVVCGPHVLAVMAELGAVI